MNGKASFVLYCDIYQHLALLTDTEAGQLFKGIVSYAAGEPMQQNLSPAGQMAFSFIKAQIDRDSQKWDEVREKRRMAGRAGQPSPTAKGRQTRQMPILPSKRRQIRLYLCLLLFLLLPLFLIKLYRWSPQR